MTWADELGGDEHDWSPLCDIKPRCIPVENDNMRCYIAGPMTGLPDFGFPIFDSAAAWLREDGYKVTSPAELDRAVGFDPQDPDNDVTVDDAFMQAAMRRDVDALLKVDAVVVLPGWESSAGVAIELTVARALGLPVYEMLANPCADGEWACLDLLLAGDQETMQQEATVGPGIRVDMDNAVWKVDDCTFVTAPTGGTKGSKPQQLAQVPPRFLMALGEVYSAGAAKYPDTAPGRPNWSAGYPWSLSYSAMQRHLAAFWSGEYHDPDDGLPHLLHAAWHCATLYTWHEEGIAPECDDRPAYLRPLAEPDLYIDHSELVRVTGART